MTQEATARGSRGEDEWWKNNDSETSDYVAAQHYINRVIESTKLAPEKVKTKGPFYLFLGDMIANIQCGGRLHPSLG